MAAPLFIVFEGIDGSGTTTQTGRMADHIPALGHDVVRTREPGGTPLAERIRALVLEPTEEEVEPTAELLLYAASRAQHVAKVIVPSLATGTPVVCDRFTCSTLAYQGFGRQLDRLMVNELNELACMGTVPDLTIFLELPAAESNRRRLEREQQPDRLEAAGDAFLERVRTGYTELARTGDQATLIIDATADADAVATNIIAEVESRWPGFPYRD
mgnify:FL=1